MQIMTSYWQIMWVENHLVCGSLHLLLCQLFYKQQHDRKSPVGWVDAGNPKSTFIKIQPF
jgi:hypothetical protein